MKTSVKLESKDLRNMVEDVLYSVPALKLRLEQDGLDLRSHKWVNRRDKYRFTKDMDIAHYAFFSEPPDRDMTLDQYHMSNTSTQPGWLIGLIVDRDTGYYHGYFAEQYGD